ncbi:YwqH-like family protein [Enterococcus sp. DIV0187]|uniref:YwqH-like family protein n=1 Tax=Enterococcus sp. DIV0187 TaxID=2774644 RepID=UPI003F277A85
MSDAAKEARIRQAEAKERAAHQQQLKLNDVKAKKVEVDGKIERLEKAKSELTSALSALSSFSSSVTSSLKSIDSGSFQGTRRDKYDSKVGDVTKKLTKLVSKHKKNQTLIDKKLTELKENSQRMGMSIGSLSTSIASLTAAARSLRA